jgi:hypothetical protein
MKSLAALMVLGLLAGSAPAAEISRSTLAEIGLPGFTKMSQANAMNVRGKGFVAAISGSSWAAVSGAGSTNAYSYSTHGHSSGASGSNSSYAAASVTFGTHTATFGFSAGGASAISISH